MNVQRGEQGGAEIMSVAAITVAALLVASPSITDADRIAAKGGFLLGNAQRCGIDDNRVTHAGQVIRTLISAAAPDDKAEEDATRGSPPSLWSAPCPTRNPTNSSRRASASPPSFAGWKAIASICPWSAPVTRSARRVRLGRRTASKLAFARFSAVAHP